jgi:hypothetical protein
LVATAGVSVACSSPSEGERELHVGVRVQPALAAQVDAYRVRVAVDGVDRADLRVPGDRAASFPYVVFEERIVSRVGGDPEATIEITAFGRAESNAPSGDEVPLVRRVARARFPVFAGSLLPLALETDCATGVAEARAPSCPDSQTCSQGRCIDPFVAESELSPYDADWATRGRADRTCAAPNGGAPTLVIGTGQTDYLPLADGQVVELERGPQGGHHVWVAFRAQNVSPRGALVELTARQPDGGAEAPKTSFVFSLDPAEGDACKLFGLRYQLDNGTTPLAAFLGKPLDVTVRLRDEDGFEAHATKRILVATTVR